jgi:hypothetical protein
MLNYRARLCIPVLVLTLILTGAAMAFAVTIVPLPAPSALSTGQNGDFLAYSAAVNEALFGIPKPQSANGQIQNDLVLYSHNPSGNLGNNNNPQICSSSTNNCVDNPFPTPTGAGSDHFDMTATNEPGPSFTGDIAARWNIKLDALKTYLTQGGQTYFPVFMFDQNQTGEGVSQDVYAWGLVTVGIPNGSGGFSSILGQFELCGPTQSGASWGTPAACADHNATPNGDFTDTSHPGEFVQAIGEECLDASGADVPCSGPHAFGPFKNNLGTNTFEFELISLGLNNLLAGCWSGTDCSGAVFSADFKLRNLNDGDETVAMFGAQQAVPEPGTVQTMVTALLGLGFLAAGYRFRK